MIVSLRMRNIALIEELTMEFGRGLHVLSGETGAGKSIVVDAVTLALGGRADRELIRTGTDKAWVEALFDVADAPAARAWLGEHEIDAEDGLVTLYREITRSGRNVCRISGVLMPVADLRELAEKLMDIHGQHEHRFLMDPEFHLRFLDDAGDAAHRDLLAQTAAACEAFLNCHRRYGRLVRENEQKQRRMEELDRSLAELDKAKLRAGEEEELTREKERAAHAGKISSAVGEAWTAIASGEPEPVLAALKPAVDALRSIAPLGEDFASLADRAGSAYYELEELGYELGAILEKGEFDPQRAEWVTERLELIRRLERRYGGDIPAVLAEQERLRAERDRLGSLEKELSELEAEDRRLLQRYRALARSLTASRHAIADAFERRMTEQLADLGMEKTVFQVAFAAPGERQPMPRPEGDDRVEFMISPNPGEPLKPLSRIASGGELSRLMLAVKSLEAERGGVGCMVFDEIDTGISGRMAQVVAEKMARIALSRQVLCVTHLPQIAAMADAAYLVEKGEENGRTNTHVRRLTPEGHAAEVARMLGGADGSDESAMAHAERMIAAAQSVKAARTAR